MSACMLKQIKPRVLSLLLILIVLTTAVTASVSADNSVQVDEILPVSDVPETINRDEAIANGHIARLRDEESDMYSAIFQNEDGSKTMYMFSSPIKYVAEDGSIRDKSTKLTYNQNNYFVKDNDVKLTFGVRSADVLTMQYREYSIALSPNIRQ